MKLVIGNGSVEIVQINPVMGALAMLITIPCTAAEVATPDIQAKALHKANFAFWYLQQEGFIQKDDKPWFFKIGVVASQGTNEQRGV